MGMKGSKLSFATVILIFYFFVACFAGLGRRRLALRRRHSGSGHGRIRMGGPGRGCFHSRKQSGWNKDM